MARPKRMQEDAERERRDCEACGLPSARIENAHVVPKALGGVETILLCYRCHLDAPDVTDPKEMARWIDSVEPAALTICRTIIDTFKQHGIDTGIPGLQDRTDEWMEHLYWYHTVVHAGYSLSTATWVLRTAIIRASRGESPDDCRDPRFRGRGWYNSVTFSVGQGSVRYDTYDSNTSTGRGADANSRPSPHISKVSVT